MLEEQGWNVQLHTISKKCLRNAVCVYGLILLLAYLLR